MILRRLTENLRTQNWTAITIELGIVILGVFIGTQVSNWNQQRLEQVETQRMLAQLAPNLNVLTAYFSSARSYYATTRRYASTALSGWRGDRRVSDRDFVTAAYQASQITGVGTNGAAWATVLGADQLRGIDNVAIRNDLSFLMSTDYSVIDLSAVNTPYRQNVRRLIPIEVQEALLGQCGDRSSRNGSPFVELPPTCDLKIAPEQAANAASILRAHPQLVEDLQWQLAAEANLLTNLSGFETTTRDLQRRIGTLRN